jgi:spoIIIJ-associated protein
VKPESPTIEPKAALEEMLRHLGFAVTVTESTLEDQILLDIQTDDPGRLIGRAGQTLSDLQFLLNRLVFKNDSRIPRVVLDVGGYRQQARELLTSRAKEAAEKVRRRGEIAEMEPLNAYDRYIVHQALKDDPDIETHSVEVDGSEKKVILIRPKKR